MDGGLPSIADRQAPGAVEPDQGSLNQPTVVPEVDTSLPGARVLDRAVAERRRPKQIIEAWRQDDNHHRPRSALAYQTPAEVAQGTPAAIMPQTEHTAINSSRVA